MEKIISLAIVFFSLQPASFAQEDTAAKFAATITQANLKRELTIIAGDEMEGRKTGTAGQRKAAAYIESQFKWMGLKPAKTLKGYQQFFELHQDSLVSSKLMVNGKIAELGEDYYSQIELSASGKFNAEKIIFAGYGIDDKNYSDYTGLNVQGKIVIFFSGEPIVAEKYLVSGTGNGSIWGYSTATGKKIAVAAARGAKGVFIINTRSASFSIRMINDNGNTGIYFPHKDKDITTIQHAFLSHNYAATIFNNFDTLLKMAKSGQPFGKQWAFEIASGASFGYKKYQLRIAPTNVIGVLEGSDKKEEYVFLTAHYDHVGKENGKIFHGADDDGSGTCAVIEIANAFTKAKAAGFTPRRTIVFMTVSGEEMGLWGSEYYTDHPLFPLEKTSVDLNTDMVGRIDTEREKSDTLNYIYVVGHDKLSSDLAVINEGINNKYAHLVLDYKFDDANDPNQIYRRSDHYNFARKGVPILFFTDGMLLADYHQPTDTVDKINWQLYEKRVRLIFHTAWEIANRDEQLKRDIPLVNR